MTEYIKPAKYVDDKNRGLFERLSEKYTITLERMLCPPPIGAENHWFCRIKQNEVSISFYTEPSGSHFFTHELFHVDLVNRGFSDISFVKNLASAMGKAEYIFDEIVGTLNNIFAHHKFYSDFLVLGYKPSEFVSDFNESLNCYGTEIIINLTFHKDHLPNMGLSTFITAYFNAQENHNPDQKSENSLLLSKLEAIDNNLFQILEKNWLTWTSSADLNNLKVFRELFSEVCAWHRLKHRAPKLVRELSEKYLSTIVNPDVHEVLSSVMKGILEKYDVPITFQSSSQMLKHSSSSSSRVDWTDGVPNHVFINIEAGNESVIWDLLHEYGHIIDGPPNNDRGNQLQDVERERRAWNNGKILLTELPQFYQSFDLRMIECLESYERKFQ